MEKEFVPYELALRMKQLGFEEPCFMYWWKGENGYILTDLIDGEARTNDFKAPLFQQAFRWFREKYGLDYEIPYAGNKGEYHAFVEKYVYGNNRNNPSVFTYEDAQQECLIKLIEIVEGIES
jgi:hypothetical protein